MQKLVLKNQDIEEEDKRMEATAHGDAKVQLTHMCDWDDGIGPECQVGQLWRSQLPIHRGLSCACAFRQGLKYSADILAFFACLDMTAFCKK